MSFGEIIYGATTVRKHGGGSPSSSDGVLPGAALGLMARAGRWRGDAAVDIDMQLTALSFEGTHRAAPSWSAQVRAGEAWPVIERTPIPLGVARLAQNAQSQHLQNC